MADLVRARAAFNAIHAESAFMLFRPLPYQQAWFKSEKQILLLLTGNQAGKTTSGAVLTTTQAVGYKPMSLGGKEDDAPQIGTFKGKRLLIAGESFQALRDNIIPKLKQYVPKAAVRETKKQPGIGIETMWHFRSGAEMMLMSYEQGKDAFEGALWHWAWFDEPPPQPIFNAVRRGTMATEGRTIVTATPLKEPWLYDELILPSQDETNALHGIVDFFSADMHDNCAGCHGGVLPHEQIIAYLASLPDAERQSREHGTFSHILGLEFPYVSEETHTVPDFIPPKDWPIVEICDPAMTRGLYLGWFTRDPQGRWYLFHAAQVPHASFGEMASRVHAICDRFPHPPDLRIMDSRGGGHIVNHDNEETFFDMFRALGLKYQPSHETPMQALHDWMKPQDIPGQGKIAKLRITQSVARMERGPLWAFQRFQWHPTDTKLRQYDQPGKDWIDLCRYLAGYHKQDDGWNRLRRPTTDFRPPPIAESYATQTRAMPMGRLWLPRKGGVAARYQSSYGRRRGRAF